MERLEEMKNWLTTFPLWGEVVLTTDVLSAQPGDCGLFPQGLEVLEVREDVLGGQTLRLRQQFLLRRNALRGMDAAAWLLEFQKWVAQQSLLGLCPVLGENQRFRAEKGRLVRTDTVGTGIYEVRLTAEYTNEKGE